jgi:hypothetical protein
VKARSVRRSGERLGVNAGNAGGDGGGASQEGLATASEGGALGPWEIGRHRRELLVDVGRLRVGFGANNPLGPGDGGEKIVLGLTTSCARPIGTTVFWARHVTQRQLPVSCGEVASVHEKQCASGQ